MKRYVITVATILTVFTLPFIAIEVSRLFSPPEPIPAVSPMAGDGLIYPSIEEMQEWCGAEVDGIWGPETDRLYRAKWARVYNDKAALKLWPETEK